MCSACLIPTPLDALLQVTIMEVLHHKARVCRIYDYGVTDEGYFITTAWYRMSLKSWRSKQPKDSLAVSLPLYLGIGAKLIRAVCGLDEHRVVHYDLKVTPHTVQ